MLALLAEEGLRLISSRFLIDHLTAARVVSTSCSACDMEIGASGNPVFDLERFGVQVVASPRYAEALIVTGPVSKGMQFG